MYIYMIIYIYIFNSCNWTSWSSVPRKSGRQASWRKERELQQLLDQVEGTDSFAVDRSHLERLEGLAVTGTPQKWANHEGWAGAYSHGEIFETMWGKSIWLGNYLSVPFDPESEGNIKIHKVTITPVIKRGLSWLLRKNGNTTKIIYNQIIYIYINGIIFSSCDTCVHPCSIARGSATLRSHDAALWRSTRLRGGDYVELQIPEQTGCWEIYSFIHRKPYVGIIIYMDRIGDGEYLA